MLARALKRVFAGERRDEHVRPYEMAVSADRVLHQLVAGCDERHERSSDGFGDTVPALTVGGAPQGAPLSFLR